MNPENTFAIVVGIEKYEVGEGNNLNGPARDAGKFARWLRQKKVPAQNISLFISPLQENRDFSYLPTELSTTVKEATAAKITDVIENKLERLKPELLFFYWGGHGVINLVGERRLFYADATQKSLKNLDFNALQAFLRTDYFGSRASRQIMIVDACANYVENMVEGGAAKHLPEGSPFPPYNPVENREQFVLLAAKPGEFAINIAAEKTGLFSKEVMAQLENQPDGEWPPNMDTVADQLKQRFVTLREKGKTEQTPTISFFQDWHSNKGTLVDTQNRPQAVISSTIELSIQQKMQLVDALLKCPSMQSNRQALLREMRSYIFNAIEYSSRNNLHVLNIVHTCLNYNGGIAELISILRLVDGQTNGFRELEELLERDFPEFLS